MTQLGFIRLLSLIIICLQAAWAVTVKVGVTAGPHAQIMEKVAILAQKEGLDLKVIEFNDFILPNQALDQGDLDMNSFQHQPYLEAQVQARGLKLVSVGRTVLMPLRGYSKKIQSLKALPDGATVVLPNDPTNESRALKLLATQKLIGLKDVTTPTIQDIQDNPKKLIFKMVEAPLIPRMIDDADVCIINTDWALLAQWDPGSALFAEDIRDNPFVNLLVVREKDKDLPHVKKIVEIYHSEPIKTFIYESFKKAVIASW